MSCMEYQHCIVLFLNLNGHFFTGNSVSAILPNPRRRRQKFALKVDVFSIYCLYITVIVAETHVETLQMKGTLQMAKAKKLKEWWRLWWNKSKQKGIHSMDSSIVSKYVLYVCVSNGFERVQNTFFLLNQYQIKLINLYLQKTDNFLCFY